MAIPTAPVSIDDFNQQAQAFVKRAKEAGKSNTAIANTLNFMYQMTLQNVANQESESLRNTQVITDKNGNQMLIDTQTGEIISGYGAEGSGEEFESTYGKTPSTTTTSQDWKTDTSPLGKSIQESVQEGTSAFNQAGQPVMSIDLEQLVNEFQPTQTTETNQSTAPQMSTETPLTQEQILSQVPGSNIIPNLQKQLFGEVPKWS